MEIRTSDAQVFMRLAYLVAALDRARFSREQLEVIDAAIEACERVKAQDEYNKNRKKAYIQEKRKADPNYGQPARRKKEAE